MQEQGTPPAGTGGEQYYIEDGVHRAVALRENGIVQGIPAVLFTPGQSPRRIYARLDQLHSPRLTVSRTVTPRRNYPAMEAWLATPRSRSQMPPLHVQPLGAPGQSASVPLSQVQIVP
ncbi:MAG: hypothetical protein L0214_13020 [candidate division NC10 bacterium]|nr:hypothetical protein [candidate division NC10 bacterium]